MLIESRRKKPTVRVNETKVYLCTTGLMSLTFPYHRFGRGTETLKACAPPDSIHSISPTTGLAGEALKACAPPDFIHSISPTIGLAGGALKACAPPDFIHSLSSLSAP